jgi:hypothetical protein
MNHDLFGYNSIKVKPQKQTDEKHLKTIKNSTIHLKAPLPTDKHRRGIDQSFTTHDQ